MIRGLFGRLLAMMCGVAAASTGLALLLQERSLSSDLERAAERRLDDAAIAAEQLLERHIAATAERYLAVSGTPQLRATLELGDAPTLAHYADFLLGQHRAARIDFVGADGEVLAAAGLPGLDSQALEVEGSGVVSHDGRAYAVVSTPLEPVGRLVAVEPIDEPTLQAWSELCGARVAFVQPAAGAEAGIQRSVRPVGELELRVSSSLEAERQAMANARFNLVVGAALGLLLAFAASLVASRGLVRPIQAVQAAARRIGTGDLQTTVHSDRNDEIGDVARAFEEMIRDLRDTVGRVAEAAERVDATAGGIAQGAQRFLEVTQEQRRGNEQAVATLEEIQERVQLIARSAGESAHRLDQSVDGSTASFKELAQSGEALKENAAQLWVQTDEIARSLEQVARSAGQVARDTDALLPAVEETAHSVAEMETSARSVNAHVEETARLSGAVVEAAEGGRSVVREAVEGMETTRRTIDESERVIQGLRQRAEEIGAIVNVIDDVTDETGLLALNAAIIASQAGEHGKAFAVVADEMKALAERVQASTKEIDGVIRAVQAETANAVDSIARGAARAREGAALIQQAEGSLTEITRAARESGDRMAESARATAGQLGASAAVAQQMDSVREGVDRIRAATREQAEANEVVQRSSDELREVAQAVQRTVDTQTGGAARIGDGIEAVQRAVREITKGLEEQVAASDQLADVVRRSQSHTHSHEESAGEMGDAARALERQAEALRQAVRRFRM